MIRSVSKRRLKGNSYYGKKRVEERNRLFVPGD